MFFVSTCAPGAPAAGFALCQGSPAASHGRSEMCPPCGADEGVPTALHVPHLGMWLPAWSQCGQAGARQSSPVPRASLVGHMLPIGYQWKKCEKRGLGVPCHQVISKNTTGLNLISPGFVLCMATTCPPHPRMLCQGVLGWWHGPCPGRDQTPPSPPWGRKGSSA